MDRPILFSAPMVRALLAGTKTQTRRLIPQATQDAYDEYDDWCRNVSAGVPSSRQWESEYYLERTRIKPGDHLWVREAWRTSQSADDKKPSALEVPGGGYGWPIWYGADAGAVTWRGSKDGGVGFVTPGKLRPSMFMPRWASRLTLTVTDVRVQRLQDISGEDAEAEGAPWVNPPVSGVGLDAGDIMAAGHWLGFVEVWDSINGEGSYAANPWVAAYSFSVERRNIDAPTPDQGSSHV